MEFKSNQQNLNLCIVDALNSLKQNRFSLMIGSDSVNFNVQHLHEV